MAGEEHEEDDDNDDNDSQTFIESNPMNNRRVGDGTRGYSSSGVANISTGNAKPRPLLVNPTKKITLASSIVGHASLANTTAAAARTPARADAMARATIDTVTATATVATTSGGIDEENDLVIPFYAGEDNEDEDAVFAFDSPDDKSKIKIKINKPHEGFSPPNAPATTTTAPAVVAAPAIASKVDVVVSTVTSAASPAVVPSETAVPKLSVAERVAAFQQKHSNNSSSSASITTSPKRHAASPLPSPRLSLASATTSLASLDRPYTGSVQPPPFLAPTAVPQPDKGLDKRQGPVSGKDEKDTYKTTAPDPQQQQVDEGMDKGNDQQHDTKNKPVAAAANIAVATPSSASAPSSSTSSSFFRSQTATVRSVDQFSDKPHSILSPSP